MIGDGARSKELGGRDLARRVSLEGQFRRGNDGNRALLCDLLHSILRNSLVAVGGVEARRVGADLQFFGRGGDCGGVGADAGIVALGGIGLDPLLESVQLSIRQGVSDQSGRRNRLFLGERGQLVEGDEDFGGAGIENVDEISGGGDGSGIDEDVEMTEVLAQELFCLAEARYLDQHPAKVGDLLEGEAGGGVGGVGDKEGGSHGGRRKRKLRRKSRSPQRIGD